MVAGWPLVIVWWLTCLSRGRSGGSWWPAGLLLLSGGWHVYHVGGVGDYGGRLDSCYCLEVDMSITWAEWGIMVTGWPLVNVWRLTCLSRGRSGGLWWPAGLLLLSGGWHVYYKQMLIVLLFVYFPYCIIFSRLRSWWWVLRRIRRSHHPRRWLATSPWGATPWVWVTAGTRYPRTSTCASPSSSSEADPELPYCSSLTWLRSTRLTFCRTQTSLRICLLFSISHRIHSVWKIRTYWDHPKYWP